VNFNLFLQQFSRSWQYFLFEKQLLVVTQWKTFGAKINTDE